VPVEVPLPKTKLNSLPSIVGNSELIVVAVIPPHR
jgi:hypothetical protein